MSRTVVAMSGGVDSSVAALLLHADKHDVVGVSMQVWDYRKNGGCESRATCCSPDDFTDARLVASRIGIPYYVFDFESTSHREVIEPFVRTYQIGKTPNPCVECNNKVKFRELRKRAQSLGYAHVATGHFARIDHSDRGPRLLRGKDRGKDQSYFLYGLLPDELSRTVFPVGELLKSEVREIARENKLPTASKPESQDICFVQGELKDFLRKQALLSGGEIRDIHGKLLGHHDGIETFTVGQRKGVGVSGQSEPLYVVEIEPDSKTVFIGPKSALETPGFEVEELNWINPEIRKEIDSNHFSTKDVIVQVRHRHSGIPARLVFNAITNSVRIEFTNDWTSISPGQTAVFYDLENQEVLGGGKILRSLTQVNNKTCARQAVAPSKEGQYV